MQMTSSVIVVPQVNAEPGYLECHPQPPFLLQILLLTIWSSFPKLSFSQLHVSSSFLSHHYFLQGQTDSFN